jgi:hypothetical protein
MVAGISGTTLQNVLQVLFVVSVLLTLRAILSQTWVTMWLAALVSLIASLVAIWSFGSLLFLLTCVQLVAAVAIRHAGSMREWALLLFAAVATFGLVVYGLAFLRLWDLWVSAWPLAFLAWSVLLRPRRVPRHQSPLVSSTP